MGYEPDNAVRDPDYYLKRPTLNTPTFEGETAKYLGIQGTFDEKTFRRLFAGRKPDEEVMLPGLRNVANSVGATDHTFNRDKPISLLKLIGQDERIAGVEERAERAALHAMESMVAVKIRKRDEIEASKAEATTPKTWRYPIRHTGNMLYVKFTHPESRENDPHSHSHVLVFNLSYDKKEKQFKRLDLRHIDRKEISRVYHETLAKGMRGLGYDAHWDGKRIEVSGVPKGMIDEFSRRSLGVAETKKRYPGLSKQGQQKVQLFDRPQQVVRTLAEHTADWFSRVSHEYLETLRRLVSKTKLVTQMESWHQSIRQQLTMLRSWSIEPEDGLRERRQEMER